MGRTNFKYNPLREKHLLSLGVIGQYRKSLMGISAIGIILCHAIVFNVQLSFLKPLFNLGNLGVDIFYLLSGFGIYYSLHKYNSGASSLRQFYCKRLFRILIPYAIIIGPSLIITCIINNGTLSQFLYYFSFVSYFKEHFGLWFIPSILLLYLISPFYYYIFSLRNKKLSNQLILTLLIVITITCICSHINGLHNYSNNSILYNINCIICRTPSFFVGFYIAVLVRKNIRVDAWVLFGVPVFLHFVFSLILVNNFSWWWLYSLPTSFVLAKLISILNIHLVDFMGEGYL